jgi:hypothetical protein
MVILPGAVLLFKENGLSLKDEIFETKSLGKDILIGIIALALTGIPAILFSFLYNFRTDLAYKAAKPTTGVTIMGVLALGLVSGIVKEIFFRGFAR